MLYSKLFGNEIDILSTLKNKRFVKLNGFQ